MSVTGGQMLRYTLLPGILPRIWELFSAGFGIIPYYIALIYHTVGLLPAGHIYLDTNNIGRYGVRHVIAEASNRLIFSRKHLDQLVVFFTVLVGIVIILMQILLFITAVLLNQEVFASGIAAYLGPFTPTGRAQDIAYIMLDHVFGVRAIFGSCIQTNTCLSMSGVPLASTYGAFPSPFHIALHTMLRFYSLGIFFIAVFVLIYFIITIAAETAESGTPFGQRLNRAWAPVRLIICFSLLVPLNIGGARNEGLNAAQHLVLWSAKLGSNFATNAWIDFNNNLTNTFLGANLSLIAKPNAPPINDLVQFMFIAKVCQLAEGYNFDDDHRPNGIEAYLVREAGTGAAAAGNNFVRLSATTFAAAKTFASNGNLIIRFGEENQAKFKKERGGVRPFCGELILPVTKIEAPGTAASGATFIQQTYYNMIVNMWRGQDIFTLATCLRSRHSQISPDPTCLPVPDSAAMNSIIRTYQAQVDAGINWAITMQLTNGNWAVSQTLRDKGWAGGAIWYNRIAEMNGDISAATFGVPTAAASPFVMNHVVQQKQKTEQALGLENAYDPITSDDQGISFPRGDADRDIAVVLSAAYNLFQGSNMGQSAGQESHGPFIDSVNALFGTSGLFSMRQNANIHPLAQLSMLGKGMMYASIRNFSVGTAGSAASGLGKSLSGFLASLGSIASKFMSTVGLATMAMSFVLYYVLPFMPFIYFMFAVGGWIKAIFEAFVAAPLWALAHLTIDGEGMPGRSANSGYFLLLEIFLRPILIMFGMLASIQIFSALVTVMHDIFDLVIANVTGFDRIGENSGALIAMANKMRDPLDQFFYTAIYVILCYMMGLGCFKLIDRIPNTIMRWMGQGAIGPMVEQAGDAANQVVGQTYQGATIVTQRVTGGQLAMLLR